ncbi:MAG: hypothetical protein U1E56_01310 [Bauldia sp.]
MYPRRVLQFCLAAMLFAVAGGQSAEARQWRTTPQAAANDYLIITDGRAANDIVLLMWMASPLMPPNADETARKFLDQYVIVGVAHMHVSPGGEATFDTIPALTASTSSQPALKAISPADMPPRLQGLSVVLTGAFKQALGHFGDGTKWFYFESAGVDPCKSGRLSIPYDGETYTFDLPVPGCAGVTR